MRPTRSLYYPPRARWHARFISLAKALFRRIPFHWLRYADGCDFKNVAAALALPGYVFLMLRRPRLGQIVIGAYAFLFLVALVWLGSSVASIAFGLMVALHAVSWASLFEYWLHPEGWTKRLLVALLAALMLAILLYLPAQRFIQSHLVMPLRINNRTLLVAPGNGHSLARGESAVFRVDSVAERGLRVGTGYVVAEILGQPGDRIYFQKGFYRVNDSVHPSLPLMPASGDWTVPENHWFTWPFSAIQIRGNLNAIDPVTAHTVLQGLSLVPVSHVVGRPLHWWFWRSLYVP